MKIKLGNEKYFKETTEAIKSDDPIEVILLNND